MPDTTDTLTAAGLRSAARAIILGGEADAAHHRQRAERLVGRLHLALQDTYDAHREQLSALHRSHVHGPQAELRLLELCPTSGNSELNQLLREAMALTPTPARAAARS